MDTCGLGQCEGTLYVSPSLWKGLERWGKHQRGTFTRVRIVRRGKTMVWLKDNWL